MDRHELFENYRFKVIIEGIDEMHFSKVSGAEAEHEIEEYKEGGYNEYTHKLHTRTNYSNLVMECGISSSKELLKWFNKNVNMALKTKTITVIAENSDGKKITLTFSDCYPVKWKMGELDAMGNGVLLEHIEFVHKGFKMD